MRMTMTDDDEIMNDNDGSDAVPDETPDEIVEPPAYMPHGKPVPEIHGPCVALAIEIRRLLGWYTTDDRPYLSSWTAGQMIGVSNSTINSITKGGRPGPDILQKFARKIPDADYMKLMELAGYYTPKPPEED